MQRYEILEKLIKDNNYKVIAEVGVNRGENAKQILERCSELTKFYLVDPDIGDLFIYDGCFRAYHYALFIRLYSKQAVKCIEDEELDLVFIDADHSYESVKEDILLWQPKVREGGIICGHDYTANIIRGVKMAVDEIYQNENIELIPDSLEKNLFIWVKRV